MSEDDDLDLADEEETPTPRRPRTELSEEDKLKALRDWYEKEIPEERRQELAEMKLTGELRYVRAGDINVDKSYQRRINLKKAKDLIRNFDPYAFEPIDVNERPDASLWSPEGQHRTIVAQIINPDMQVPCWVHKGMSVGAEANQTGTIHRGRTSFSPTDLYKTDLKAGDPEAVAVDRIASDNGLTVGLGGITAVKALRKMYATIGEDGLATVFRVINKSWVQQQYPDAWAYLTLQSVGEFVRRYTKLSVDEQGGLVKTPLFDEGHLIVTLRQWPPSALADPIRNSKEHYTSKPRAIADALAKHYNAGIIAGSDVKKLPIPKSRKKK
jgi:hypothetical protein